jgi:hypothetical protein
MFSLYEHSISVDVASSLTDGIYVGIARLLSPYEWEYIILFEVSDGIYPPDSTVYKYL